MSTSREPRGGAQQEAFCGQRGRHEKQQPLYITAPIAVAAAALVSLLAMAHRLHACRAGMLALLVASCGKPAARNAGVESAASASPTQSASAPLTEAECHALFDHLLALESDAQRATTAPELVATDAQLAAIRAELYADTATCVAAMSRRDFECAMAAATAAAARRCATSN